MTEYFDVVDENDKVIGKASREECHSNPELIHRGVMILVFNSKGDLLLQKRSMKKDLNPGKWTVSASGHVESGDAYEETSRRELMEELGIELHMKKEFSFLYKGDQESEILMTFTARSDGPFKVEPEEVDEVRFFSIGEVKKLLKDKSDLLTPGCRVLLEEYFKRSSDKS